MDIVELSRLYDGFRKHSQFDDIGMVGSKPCGLQCKNRSIKGAGRVWQELIDFAPVEGWITFCSENILFLNAEMPVFENREILNAELYNGQQSLHIRYLNRDNWVVNSYDPNVAESTYLRIKRSLLSNHPGIKSLNYFLYYELKDIHCREKFCHFCGFLLDQESI